MADVKELNINNSTYDIKAKSVVDTNSGKLKFWSGTRQEYDAITTKDSATFYTCTDSGEIYIGTTLIADKTTLYSSTGNNTDGAMTQKAATDTFADYDGIYYKSGDVYTTERAHYCAGVLTSSRRGLRFQIELPKKLTNITGVTVNSMTLTIRVPAGGYMVQLWDAVTNANSLTINIVDDTTISVFIDQNSDLYTTNNIPIIVEVAGGLTLTFTNS